MPSTESTPYLADHVKYHLQTILQQQLASSLPPSLSSNKLLQVVAYALDSPGKMVRGQILLAACQAVGGPPDQALPASVAIEYLHLGTLIHDDLIDLDEMRRGQTTVWRHYSSDLALLSGDLFYFAAFQSLSLALSHLQPPRAAQIIEIFARACMNLCLGQTQEEQLVGNMIATPDDYLAVIRLKTASLFRAALEMGAILGNGTDEQVQALGDCGENLGLAFQLIDDLLPYTSTAQQTGKPVTSDLKNRRLTAPLLYALAQATNDEQAILQHILAQPLADNDLSTAFTAVQTLFQRTAAFTAVENVAYHYMNLATNLLHTLPPNAGRAQLLHIARQLITRKN
jgi:geranylgeranyl diphosphate synthase type I